MTPNNGQIRFQRFYFASVMIRLKSRYIFVVLSAFALIFLLCFLQIFHKKISSSFETLQPCSATVTHDKTGSKIQNLGKISCVVDNEKTYQCYWDELTNEVYFPFNTFLKKRYDVSGRLIGGSNAITFEWSTSHARVRFPDFTHYDYRGAFGHFASYSVETRDRVRCISAQHGVPMSTQWSSTPYFYAIQIAQYALQHYSRLKTVPPPISFVKGEIEEDWTDNSPGQDSLKLSFDRNLNAIKIEINAADHGVSLALDSNPALVVLSFFWSTDVDGSFLVNVNLLPTGKMLILHYIHSNDDRCVWHDKETNDSDYYYSLGAEANSSEWRWICRDLLVDTGRALASRFGRKEMMLLHPGDVSVNWISFRGRSLIRNFKQRSSAHLENFLIAADWLTSNQDKQGGWLVPVERSIADKRLVLPAGWHSAMAQGHALSVLTRAYAITNDSKYYQAAKRALHLFRTAAEDGGVLNWLFDHPWYEEYPTVPGTFVLNGFLYALIGLYDFSQITAIQIDDNDSGALFASGLKSLRTFLPLFDIGSGTLYDLRHLGLKTAPNLARWDYHSVHIYLLKWLHIITKDELYNQTADRWAAYAMGHRAKHN